MAKKENLELAELLFPEVKGTVEGLENKYPPRNLPAEAIVTRAAPSPTGQVHIGTILTYLKAFLFAKESKGLIYLRIEDTDTKREVKDATRKIPQTFEKYGITFDEGVREDLSEVGAYGPYTQSKRKEIYHICAKEMVRRGLAYPCFCSAEQIGNMREEQRQLKVNTGYYGEFAKCRNLTLTQIKKNLAEGKKFTLRLRAPGYNKKAMVTLIDEVRGKMFVPQNFIDDVLIKSEDNLPTYAFAHVVDDHFMHTTHVFRADEWLATWPLHAQMFEMLGFKTPKYIHLAPLMKMEGTSRKKLSKRDGATMLDFDEKGYPPEAVDEYCMTVSFSDFEPWRALNPTAPYADFKVRFDKLSASGALLDWGKINDISKNLIGTWTAEKLLDGLLNWANEHDKEFFEVLNVNKKFSRDVLNMDRLTDRVRKDITVYSDVKGYLGYMFNVYYDKMKEADFEILANVSKQNTADILQEYIKEIKIPDEQNEWFGVIKNIAAKQGFTTDMKAYRADPQKFKGSVADAAGVIRVAVTGKQKSTDLFNIMRVLGKDEVVRRLKKFLNIFNK